MPLETQIVYIFMKNSTSGKRPKRHQAEQGNKKDGKYYAEKHLEWNQIKWKVDLLFYFH